MDRANDDGNIEDYLFSGYLLNSKSTFEKDQNFAKPIEDEDIFGFGCEEPRQEQGSCNELLDHVEDHMDLDDDIPDLGGDIYKDLNGTSPNDLMFDNDLGMPDDGPASDMTDKQASELDDIFRDDYSESSQNAPLANNENTYPGASKKKLPPAPPTPAQIKMKLFKEKVLEQARTKNITPQKPGAGMKQDDVIEVEIMQGSLVSNHNSKFIFNRLFNKSKKSSPEAEKKSWDSYRDDLRKKICSQKRKIWDSFQTRVEVYDDEEEIIEPIVPKSNPKTTEDDKDKNGMEDEGEKGDEEEDSDGNFEDLEKEDLGSEASNDEEQKSDADEPEADVDELESDVDEHENDVNKPASDVDEEGEKDIENDVESNQDLSIDDKSFEEDNSENQDEKEQEQEEKLSDDDSEDDQSFNKESGDESDGCDVDYSLNLDDDSSNETRETDFKKRRAIFIDDEASEDD